MEKEGSEAQVFKYYILALVLTYFEMGFISAVFLFFLYADSVCRIYGIKNIFKGLVKLLRKDSFINNLFAFFDVVFHWPKMLFMAISPEGRNIIDKTTCDMKKREEEKNGNTEGHTDGHD